MTVTTETFAGATSVTRSLTELRPSQMVLDPAVNRSVDEAWVNRLVETFNPLVLGAFIVWEHPDGSFHIVDGQHRYLACGKLAYDEPVAAWAYKGLTVGTANDLFLLANNQRNVHAIDKFLRSVAAGRPDESIVSAVLLERGCRVGHEDEDVSSPTALLAIVRSGGETLLRQIVGTLTEAFPQDGVVALQGPMLSGLLKVERKFRKTDVPVDFDTMKEALADTSLIDLYNGRDAGYKTDPSKPKSWHMAAQVVASYNRTTTRSKRLPRWGEVA